MTLSAGTSFTEKEGKEDGGGWGGANIKGRREGGGSKVNVERKEDEMMSKAGAEPTQQPFTRILGWFLGP